MTLLLRELVSLLAGAIVWLAVVVTLCAVPALAASHLTRGRPHLAAAVLGGLLGAGVSARLGLSDPAGLTLSGGEVPVLWTLAGGICGVLIVSIPRRSLSDRMEG